jgi:hypothetical protein
MRAMGFVMTAVLGLFLAAPASSDPLVPQTRITSVVEVRDVTGDAASVSRRLVNLSDGTVSNLKLSVSDTFLWTNERPSGSNDPSQTGTYTLAQEIPPNGSAPFTVPYDRAAHARRRAVRDQSRGHGTHTEACAADRLLRAGRIAQPRKRRPPSSETDAILAAVWRGGSLKGERSGLPTPGSANVGGPSTAARSERWRAPAAPPRRLPASGARCGDGSPPSER